MADRKLQYIIEMIADDSSLRKQMKGWDWEDIMGKKGKDFGDKLVGDTKGAINELKGLNIDWTKILGTKEIGQLEQAVTKALQGSRKNLESLAIKGDTAGIKEITEFVSGLGKELQSLGSSFDAASLARGMGAFMKVLTPLSAKFDALAKEPAKVEAAFDRLFNGVIVGANSASKSSEKIVNIMAKINTATKRTGGSQASLDKLVKKFDELKNIKLPDLSSLTLTQLEDEMDKLEDKWDTLEQRFAGKNKNNSAYQLERGKLLAEERHIADTYNKIAGSSGLDTDYISDIDKQLKQIYSMFEKAIEKLQQQLGSDTFAQEISKQLSNININLSLDEKSKANFINEINAFVKDVNKTPIEKVKIGVGQVLDDTSNPIEDQSKRAYGNNPADEDAATTELINKTKNRFDRVGSVIRSKQHRILNNTKTWRQNMIQAMQIGADELRFNFGWDGHLKDSADSLFNQLQAYFEQPENALNVYFDTKNIAKNLKAELDAEGITIGGSGGTATLDANSLASALYSVLLGQVPSGLPSGTSDNIIPSNLDDETDEAIASGKEYVAVLDETTIHIDKVIESLREFAKVATKPNASKGSKAIAEKLSNKGIDINQILNDKSGINTIRMLQTALMAKDEMGHATGSSLVEELKGMMSTYGMKSTSGAGRVVDILSRDIVELFNINDIETELIEQVETRLKQLDVWKGVEKPGRALASLGYVRSTKNRIKTPSIENIDQAIHYFEAAGEDTEALKKLREAREKLGSNESDEAKKEFEQSALVFYKETEAVFNRLRKQSLNFKGMVYAEGRKPVSINPQGAYPYKMLEVPEDAVITKVLPFKDLADTIGAEDIVGSSARRESNKNKAEREARRLHASGGGYDFTEDRPHPNKNVRYEEIEYSTFKPQEGQNLPANVEPVLESLRRQAEELPELVARINDEQAKIKELEEIERQLDKDLTQMRGEDLPDVYLGGFKSKRDRKISVDNIVTNAQDALKMGFDLQLGNTSDLNDEQSTLANRLQNIVQNINRDSEASQELANKISEIVAAKQLSKKELERMRAEAAQSGNKTQADFYRDILFDPTGVDKRMATYESEKTDIDKRIVNNKGAAQGLINQLKEANNVNASQATQEAKELATQLITLKERLYAEANSYTKMLNDPKTDKNTHQITLGKLQQTLGKLSQLEYKFATIQPYIPETSFYTNTEQKGVDNWNKTYTNKEIIKLQKELQRLEAQLTTEEDQAKVADLKKQIANTKRLITRRKKNIPANVVSETQSDLSKRRQELSEARRALSIDESNKKIAKESEDTHQQMQTEVEFLTRYNELLAKEKSLLEEINRLKKKGADQSVISDKTNQLRQATKELDDFLKAEQTEERTAYAREKAVEYQALLSTARRQRGAFDADIKNLEEDENSINQYGMSGRAGARATRKAKSQVTYEYMISDYVKETLAALREKTIEAINAGGDKTSLWEKYNADERVLRESLKSEFQKLFDVKDGVLSAVFKIKDDEGNWIDDVKTYDVKNTALSSIVKAKEIAEANRKPLDDLIDDLRVQKNAAMRYGVVDEEDLNNDTRLKEIESLNQRIREKKTDLASLNNELTNIQGNDSLDEKEKSKQVRVKQKEIDNLNQEISGLKARIQNRMELIARQRQEKEDSKLTPEEKAATATEKLATQKERLAQIEERIAQRRAEYEGAKGTEDEKKNLELLDLEIKKKDELLNKIKTTEDNITRWNGQAEAQRKASYSTGGIMPEGGLIGSILSPVMNVLESLGASADIDTEELAKEATLRAILEVLGGVPSGDDGYGLGRGKKDLGHQEAKMIDAISRDPKRMAEIEAHIEEGLKQYSTRQDEQVADPKSYADIQSLVKQYVSAYVGSLNSKNIAQGIKESVDIETSITDKLQSVVGDKFNVDQLLEQVALGAKSEDKAISEIAKAYGFKKSRQKKVATPVEPVIQSGAVAEEVKENVAEVPAKAVVTPTMDTSTQPDWISKMSEDERKTAVASINKYDKENMDKWKQMDSAELAKTIQTTTQSMKGLNKESVEYLQKQRELGRLLNLYKDKSDVKDKATITRKNGNTYVDPKILAQEDALLKSLGLYSKYIPITGDKAIKSMFAMPKQETVAEPKIKEAEATLQIKDFDEFKLQAQALKQAIEVQATGSDEQKKIQAALVQVLQAWARSEASGFGGKLPNADGWKAYLTQTGVFDEIDESITPLTHHQLNKGAKAKVTIAEKPIQKKKESKKSEPRVEGKQPESRQQATGGLIQLVSRLATENTLLQVLNALQTVGTVEGGKSAPTAAGDLYNQFKALLLGGSIDDHERLAYMNSEAGLMSGNVIGNIANISEELIRALRAKYPTAQGFDTQVHTHGKATQPYFSTEDYNHFTKDYESGIKKQVLLTKDQISVLDLSAVKSAEEVQALMDELIKADNNAKAIKKVFENNKSGALFESAKFDSLNANSLVKMIGANVDKPKDSNNVFESYISKIQEYKKVIDDAQADGYLMSDDINVKRFTEASNEIDKLINSIANGVPVTDEMKANFEQLYRNTIDYGNAVNKTIGKNKNMYSGLSEINSVNNQRDKIIGVFGEDNFKTSDMKLIQQYNAAYEKLHKTYQGFAKDRTLYDTNNQEQLRQQAAGVQILGKKLMSSIQQADELRKLVDQSGYYTDRRTGEDRGLGGISSTLSAEEASVKNLETTMRNYVQNTLKQANIENVKYNSTKQQLIYTFRTSKDTVADMVVQYNAAENALFAYNKQERESLTGWPAFIQGMKSKIKSITQYIFSITSITRVWSEIKRGIQYIREIDSALTELKKVTDATEETYDKFLDTAAKTADKVGSTIKEVVSSTADWARLGYSMEEAHQLAESTQILMNVSEFTDISTATDSLISSIQAFKYTAEESMDVVDILNTIGNNYAISTADLATSLTKSSGSLVAANGTLEEAVALTATANTIIQDADVVGTALKTVAMRLRGTSTEEMEEEGLDTDGAVTSKSKLQSKIKGLAGVDILTDTGAYKSTYQILSEIAAVWEDINDMDQAALLELLAGKRAGSVMSAILQNPDTLKDAFESANEASGSALAENEKYLDSIQGRIDLFNNAVQTMWSNALDDNVVKWFVDLGTTLVKIVDTLGLIPTILLAIGAFKGFGFIFKGFDIATLIQDLSVLTMGTKVFEAETRKAAYSLLSETIQSKLAGSALVQYAIKMGLATAADVGKMTTTQLLGLSFKALGMSILGATKAIIAFLFTNPVGWAILATGAIVGLVAILNKVIPSTEELKEKLSELKTEVSSMQSELDSLNSELETTQNRMSELLAMPSLSFTEQEELKNLQKQNDELEREIYLLEQRQKRKQKEAEDTFDDVMYRAKNIGTVSIMGAGYLTEAQDLNTRMFLYEQYAKEEKDASDELVKAEQSGNKKEIEKAEKKLKKAEKKTQKEREYIDKKIEEWTDAAEGIDYNLADDETKEYLDYIYNLEDKFNIISGDSQAKSIAITRVFNKEEFEGVSEEIDKLVEKYKATGDITILDQISVQASKAKKDLEAIGLSVDDVVNYFTLESSGFDSGTFDGILNQYATGNKVLQQMMSSTNFEQDWGEFFTQDDEGNFKARADKFGEILEGMDDDAKETFMGVVESAVNGADNLNSIDWNKAISSFNVSGIIAATKVIEAQFEELNKSVFKDLDDEISGFIDTFSELGSALEDVSSSMDLLNTAQKQFENSGQISVKTALQLIESTDQWDKVLTFTNGTIGLTSDAEDVLVQSKLNVIKANIDEALTSAQLQLQQLGTADSTLLAASATDVTSEAYGIYHNAMNSYTASIAAFGAAIDALMSGNITDVFSSAKSAYNASKEISASQDEVSAKELRTQIKNLQAQKSLIEKVGTTSAFKNYYDYDETPGDKDTSSGSTSDKNDKFQKEMDYWENRIGAEQSRFEQVQNEVDLLEKQGKVAGEAYYEEQIASEKRRLGLLQQQKDEAKKYLGQFKEGSDEWWEVANTLNDIEGEMDDVTASIQDLSDAMAEVDWYIFDETSERFSKLHDELGTIRDLVAPNGEEDWFDDEGMWTDKGTAYLATYISDLEFYEGELVRVNKKLDEEYNRPYVGNEAHYKNLGIDSEQELYDARQKLIDQQYDIRKAQSDTQQSVADMYESQIDAVEEYTSELVDSYNDYIDVVKEALDAERDLYEFKKNIQKQTKDIASLERRIASLSGSDNAADIAERRKLEAELYEKREDLNDTYYDHAKDAQQKALEDEASAYEETMNKFIEGLRTSLKTATQDMSTFMGGVYNAVIQNAPAITKIYGDLGLELDAAITDPWTAASEAIKKYQNGDGKDLGLSAMNAWIGEGGIFPKFKTDASDALSSPWRAGTTALNEFKGSVDTQMGAVVSSVKTNVSSSLTELNKLKTEMAKINGTSVKPSVNTGGSDRDSNVGGDPTISDDGNKNSRYERIKALQTVLNGMFSAGLTVDGVWGSASQNALKKVQKQMNESSLGITKVSVDGMYGPATASAMQEYIDKMITRTRIDNNGSSFIGQAIQQYTKWKNMLPIAFHAKGTLGTKRDELAVTDESWIGEEITLAAGKNGQLQYLKKGSAVMPADISANLVEWGKLNPDMMNIGGVPNLNMISNAINKPEFNISFDSLVKAENITEETLPAVKKLVTQELNRFTKELNYAIKGYAR